MAKRPAVAKSELEVAQLVWQLGQASGAMPTRS
jgi:hypothetical protein